MNKNAHFLPFAMPSIGEEEISEVEETLRSGWMTTGPKVKRFENDFRKFVGATYALAVNSGTSGLHLALESIGVGPGDAVLTTPYTFTATAEVIRYLGADPLFVDIDPQTCNIDPDKASITLSQHSSIKAIIPVHFAGQACDMDAILFLANEYNLKVVEDAAHAFPTTYKGGMVGTFGDLTVYSFYVTKSLATGEGGMVVTENPSYAKRISTMRLHGINQDVYDRYTAKKPSWYYEVIAPGFKYNMTDIAAAIGIHQLRKAELFRLRREQIAKNYSEAFESLPLRVPFVARPDDMHAWHIYSIQLETERLTISRKEFIEKMCEAGIGTSVHFIPLHLHPYWRERYKLTPEDYPVSLDVFNRAVSLPIYPGMKDQDVERVILAVRRILLSHTKE
jgi:dTDP-4-amino-4,6-dideoxygalactose transaminase